MFGPEHGIQVCSGARRCCEQVDMEQSVDDVSHCHGKAHVVSTGGVFDGELQVI